MICTVSLLLVYTGWTVGLQKATTAEKAGGHNGAASAACAFFIFIYQPCYNLGFNALTYTYMVEVWPYMERSRGIAVFQLFGRLAGFFTTYVNPIGLSNISWKWLLVYVCWLAYEVVFVWFMFPETANRTLEELAFRKCFSGHVWVCERIGLMWMQCLRARSAHIRLRGPWRKSRLCIGRTRLRLGRRARGARKGWRRGSVVSARWSDVGAIDERWWCSSVDVEGWWVFFVVRRSAFIILLVRCSSYIGWYCFKCWIEPESTSSLRSLCSSSYISYFADDRYITLCETVEITTVDLRRN
jgi:hypothetical protein